MTMTLMAGHPGTGVESKRRRLDELATQLKNARQSFEPGWKEIAELFRPRRIRLQTSDRNKGDRRNQKIIDSTTVNAARVLSSGISSGITSSARRWHKMTISDKTLLEQQSVAVWLDDVNEKMADVLTRSNFYEVLATFYSDLGVFGTSALIVEEDDDKVIRCTHFALGEYWLGYNAKQQCRVFMREFELTVRQVVEQFGEKRGNSYSTANLSDTVQSAWRGGQTETGIAVRHVIYENADYTEQRIEAKHKRYASCYYEIGGKTDIVLHEGGYDEWPIMAVRWEANTGDVYGTDCPGMTALGDAKELMASKKKGGAALEKAVNPPMIGNANNKNNPASILPGGMTWVPGTGDVRNQFAPAIDTSAFRLDWLSKWIEDLKDLINQAFFVDLFLVISQIDRGNVTATEVLEKKEEKLLTLGPVGKQIDGGFLDPFFDRLYGIMLRGGLIPEPPPEMEGVAFHPEYESIMAQAQRAQGRSGVLASLEFTAQLAALTPDNPAVLDRLDTDEMLETFFEMAGSPPKFLRSDEEVAEIRGARAQAAQAEAAAAQVETMAGAANQLAGADMSGNNALTQLVGGPLNGAQGGI